MDHSVLGPNIKIILEKLDTWHSIQFRPLERAKNQQGKVTKTFGTSKFGQTCGIAKKTYQNTTCRNFRLRRDEISEIHYEKFWPTK